MDPLTAATLIMIEAAPVDLSVLAWRVAEELSIPCDQGLNSALTAVVERLSSAGLIESASQ
jgi:hypothetical protein